MVESVRFELTYKELEVLCLIQFAPRLHFVVHFDIF